MTTAEISCGRHFVYGSQLSRTIKNMPHRIIMKKIATFAQRSVPRAATTAPTDQKGIGWESRTVPAAVCFYQERCILCHWRESGRHIVRNESEDLPDKFIWYALRRMGHIV